MPLLQLQQVFKKGPGDFELRDITFLQERGEKISIAGETGAGKSSVMKVIAGLLQPDRGSVLFENERVQGPDEKLVPGHPAIAYLSQHFELQKSLRVEQVLMYSNKLTDREARKLFQICQIDHLLQRRTDELSGGEKQRVAICRLLISSPRLLLLDEPYAHLDMTHKDALKDVIRDIGDRLKITCMLVSHDPQDSLSWAHRVIVMRDGSIVQVGAPEDVYNRPADEYTAGLFGKYNVIEKEHMRAFSKLAVVKKAAHGSKRLFVRPEQFRIVRKSDSALRGKVHRVRFYGTFSEVDVLVSKKVITVRSGPLDAREGEVVFITLANRRLWSI